MPRHDRPRRGARRLGRLSSVGVGLALAAFLPACGSPSDDAESSSVVATTTIIGDVLSEVVGPDEDVEVLMPIGADPHEFSLSARQAATLQNADLIVANGLGFEIGMLDAVTAAEDAGVPVLNLGESLDPLSLDDHDTDDHDTDDHDTDDHESVHDPHWFTDPVRMAEAAVLMADALIEHTDAPPEVAQRGQRVADDLLALDDEVRTIMAPIESENRRLVTNHEVLGYFADRYDFVVIDTIIPGGATLAQPSAADLSDLTAKIERADVAAIFVETSSSQDLARSVAEEVGRPVEVVDLYTESLGAEGSAGDSYEGMIRTDARRIAEALAS